MSVSVVKARLDAYVNQAAPDANRGDTTHLVVQSDASAINRAFIFFPRPFPVGAIIQSAILRLTCYAGWATLTTVTAQCVAASWKESGPGGITYNNQPGISGSSYTNTVAAGAPAGTTVDIDVTGILSAAAAGTPYYGIRLFVNTTGKKTFYSSNYADPNLAPMLTVTWVLASEIPTGLAPAGGLVVALQRPMLSWIFPDQGQYQVQVDDTADLSSPIYDSGWIVSSVQQLDLSTTGISALSDNTTYYWRVRCINADGQTSVWSDIATFTRNSVAVLTITSPSGATVDDATPVITHTFVGRTQAAVNYFIDEQDPTTLLYTNVYDSGRISTTATTYTLPDKNAAGDQIIRFEARNYRLTLRVYDSLQREALPGDLPYVSSQKIFTYVRNGTPTAPTGLAVTGTPADPEIPITWGAAVRPDFFALKLDGEIVGKRIDPATVEDSPGANTYHMSIWNLTPGVSHSISMERVTISGGKFINSNPLTVNYTPNWKNKWLMAPVSGIKVCIVNPDDPDTAIGQDGETFFPIGRRDPVRINSMVRGYEGTCDGSLADMAGVTAVTYKARMERIIGLENSEELRLAWRDVNMRVQIGEAAIKSSILGWYAVAFEFWQVDDFAFATRL